MFQLVNLFELSLVLHFGRLSVWDVLHCVCSPFEKEKFLAFMGDCGFAG